MLVGPDAGMCGVVCSCGCKGGILLLGSTGGAVSTGVEGYWCILQSAANNLVEMPRIMRVANSLTGLFSRVTIVTTSITDRKKSQ